jgi:hypothetical protein
MKWRAFRHVAQVDFCKNSTALLDFFARDIRLRVDVFIGRLFWPGIPLNPGSPSACQHTEFAT